MMLDVTAIRFAFPGQSFQFDLHVETGSFTAIIGPSGGGKSTLLHLIAGFETPTSGTIAFNGKDITTLHPSQRPLSIIFQDNNLFPHLTVQENAALGIAPSLKLSTNQQQQVMDALSRVGLFDKANKKPGELSGGERQRAAIARTLLRDKPLLLLDEAFAALGPALRHDMLTLVKKLHTDQRLTTLMVSHHTDDARTVASHIAFVANGEVKLHGTTQEVLSSSSNPELQAYLGETV
jgi:thiamine transport system ATP-binding protein